MCDPAVFKANGHKAEDSLCAVFTGKRCDSYEHGGVRMDYLFTYCTEKGPEKTCNQDSLLVKKAVCGKERILLAVICDGMGGLMQGEVASASLVKAFSAWFEKELPRIISVPKMEQSLLWSWDILLKSMDRKIKAYGRQYYLKIGTAVTALLLFRGEYYIAHVGDSRVYELCDQVCQLTKDQTVAAWEAERGILTPAQAERSPGSSILLQCIGASETVEPVYMKGQIAKGAAYMLCCDGFRHVVSKEEMQQTLFPFKRSDEKALKRRLEKLTALNRTRGEMDDISVIIIYPLEESRPVREK